MNEDDTFRILRQTPAATLAKIVRELSHTDWLRIAISDGLREEFLASYGWTLKEYEDAYNKGMIK
jgi:hypothetical protein